jgi:hypothetical protein
LIKRAPAKAGVLLFEVIGMDVAPYKSLFKRYKDQPVGEVFAHFHPEKDPLTGSLDFDAPFKKIAAKTIRGSPGMGFYST